MTPWHERVVTAVCTAAPLLIAGSMWLGELDNRVEQLESRLTKVESAERSSQAIGQSAPKDAVGERCADLATKLAESGGDAYPKQEAIKGAMAGLGCFRAN